MTKHTDTELLDWLEKQDGCGLISDDAGRWAVSTEGVQDIPSLKHAIDIGSCFFTEAAEWRGSIREAIEAAMEVKHD